MCLSWKIWKTSPLNFTANALNLIVSISHFLDTLVLIRKFNSLSHNARQLLKSLIEKNPIVCNNTRSGSSALHLASFARSLDFIKYIANYVEDINPAREDGLTPMHIAAWKGNREMLEYYLKSNINLQQGGVHKSLCI